MSKPMDTQTFYETVSKARFNVERTKSIEALVEEAARARASELKAVGLLNLMLLDLGPDDTDRRAAVNAFLDAHYGVAYVD